MVVVVVAALTVVAFIFSRFALTTLILLCVAFIRFARRCDAFVSSFEQLADTERIMASVIWSKR